MNKHIFINGRFLTQEMTGIQRFSYEITKALIRKGVDVVVLAPRKIRKEYTLNGEVIRFGHFSNLPWEQVDLPLFLRKKGNPLLLNFGSPGPLFYSNRIVTIHDLSFLVHPDWFSKSYRFYYKYATPLAARRSKKIITVSECSKMEIVARLSVSEDKVAVIPNAVSAVFMQKSTGNPLEKGKYILSVGSMDPRKNWQRLADAYKLAGIEKEVKLVVAGKRDAIFNIDLPAGFSNHTKGHVPDEALASLYQHAALFVYPSLYEGFGIPPLEAMSMGCPVILSDIPVFREVFGDAAHYVNPLSAESIRDGIQRVLSDEPYRKELVRKGTERANHYSWEESARRLISLIDDLP